MPALSIMVKPVSGACNMHCRYCFYTDVMSRRQTAIYPRMTLETLEALVRRAFRCADGQISFAFQGGEPTLIGLPFFEALMRFERAYNTRGLAVSNAVQTNGYDMPEELLSFFVREGFLIGVSLDGDRAAHDLLRLDRDGAPTYDRVRANVERFRRAGAELNILCVVNEYVARRPREVFQALAPCRNLQFIACLDDFDGEKTDYSLTEESYLRFLKITFDLYYEAFCAGRPVSIRNFDNYLGILLGIPPESCAMSGQCGQYFLIEADGSVYPCDFYVLDAWRMGNIRDTSFSRLSRSPASERFLAESLPVPPQCKACEWYALCRNGCKRERDAQSGINRWCACYRAFFSYAVPRFEDMARRLRDSAR